MANGNGFTPTQARIIQLLSDGLPHKRDDVFAACIEDDLATVTALQLHISNLRPHLRARGEDIVCVVRGYVHFYQHVRLLASANDGRK